MTTHDGNDSTAEITHQAAAWWVLLTGERRLSFEERWQLVLWLRRPRHIYELVRAMRSRKAAERGQSNIIVVDFWRGSSPKPAETRRPHRVCVAAMAMAAAAVVLPLGSFVLSKMNVETPDSTIATAVNEPRTEQLEDGSVISLGPRSRVRVEFTKDRRVVHLLEGEVTVDVAKDTARPFVVSSLLVDATAVGTKFSVAMIDTTVAVVEVYEGVVEVSVRGAAAGVSVVTLKEGQTHRVSAGGV